MSTAFLTGLSKSQKWIRALSVWNSLWGMRSYDCFVWFG
jgi:hypothetical protein